MWIVELTLYGITGKQCSDEWPEVAGRVVMSHSSGLDANSDQLVQVIGAENKLSSQSARIDSKEVGVKQPMPSILLAGCMEVGV